MAIEAVQIGDGLSIPSTSWISAAVKKEEGEEGSLSLTKGEVSVSINTLEGTMKAYVGDYIIQGVHGEIYPCKPDIFEKTYYTEEEYAKEKEKE